MKRVGKTIKILACSVIAVLVLGVGLWFAMQYLQPKPPIPPELALKDDAGNVVTGPNGEMFYDYTGNLGELSESVDAETNETSYFVSGVWRWNEKLLPLPDSKDGKTTLAKVSFNTAANSETSIIYEKRDTYFKIRYSNGDAGSAYVEGRGWLDATGRILDFGNEMQEVSKVFYDYLLANASPTSRDEYVQEVERYLWECKVKEEEHTLSGYWIWNEDLDFSGSSHLVEFSLNGSLSNGIQFASWHFSYAMSKQSGSKKTLMYGREDGELPSWELWNDRDGWGNDASRYIYLGDEPQIVSGDDYYFFVANASPCTKEEFDAMAELYQQAE